MSTTPVNVSVPIAHTETLSNLEAGEDASDDKLPEANGAALDLQLKRVKKQWNMIRGKYDDVEFEEKYISAFDVGYAFSVVRIFKPGSHISSAAIHVRSRHFIAAAQDVMKGKRNVAWKAIPVKFEALELLAFLPQFIKNLEERQRRPIEEGQNIREHNNIIYHLEYFVDFLKNEYSTDLQTVTSLRAERHIAFDSLWALLVPGMTLTTKCAVTGAQRLVRLITISKQEPEDLPEWALLVEYVDIVSGQVGLVEEELIQEKFYGNKPIVELVAYPFEEPISNGEALVDNYKEVRAKLVDRGRRRSKIKERSCMWYHGDGFYKDGDAYRKDLVKSRVMIDHDMYDQQTGHLTPRLARGLDHETIGSKSRTTLNDDEYALMAPIVYGLELEKKNWYQFFVDDIKDIIWNTGLFDDLHLDKEHKIFLKAIVDACYPEIKEAEGIVSGAEFDDFLWCKGKGFICNLHGPPGVGKMLTVEALSDVKKNVLYVVGCGDLGIEADNIEKNLSTIFQLAVRWKAILLIHGADVYLEDADILDTRRNAVESVFMRRLEYYPGVVFLTTNRDTVLKSGIRSRIDLSFIYHQPTVDVRGQLWDMFLKKTNMSIEERQIVDKQYMKETCKLCLNGREIKSVVKMAKTLAMYPSLHRSVQASDIMSSIQFLKTQGQIGGMFVAQPRVEAPVAASRMDLFTHAACGVVVGLALCFFAI